MSRIAILAASITSCAITAAVVVFAQEKTGQEGNMPFTPTRSEWLTLKMKEIFKSNKTWIEESVEIYGYNPNEISVTYVYDDSIDDYIGCREMAEFLLSKSKENAEKYLKEKGWDSWCKIKTRIFASSNGAAPFDRSKFGPTAKSDISRIEVLHLQLWKGDSSLADLTSECGAALNPTI